ncbi:MAG TPA: hypothetical protein DCY13_24830 [Verrucomicrobiales bacterium]|nr:hypothetical protein [Verrucomicrobiales bacterium]
MDEQQAKFLLQSGRPRPGDAEDPAFLEALKLADANPPLRAWMEEQQALTDSLQRKLGEVPVPADLKQRILAGAAVTRPAPHPNRRRWFAMAAAGALLLGWGGWQLTNRRSGGGTDIAGLRGDMTAFLDGYFSLDLHTRHLDRVKQHLADVHQFTDYQIPTALAGHDSVGCRKLDWNGGRVMLVCFSVDGELVHLFITPRGTLNPVPEPGTRIAARQEGRFATVGWSDEKNLYLVATPGSAEFLRGTLGGARG